MKPYINYNYFTVTSAKPLALSFKAQLEPLADQLQLILPDSNCAKPKKKTFKTEMPSECPTQTFDT